MTAFLRQLNVIAECRRAGVAAWSCPSFLFVIMGLVNIAAMVGSYLLSARFIVESEVAALIVISVSAVILIIGSFIIHGFNQVAEASRIKSEFIAIVSHQLRSPLSIFKWAIDALARGGVGRGGAEADGSIKILRENAEKMIQMVNMLLDASRIDSGRLILRRDPVRLDAVAADIIKSLASYALASNIGIDFVSPPALPPVKGDEERVRMVVTNLIDNAIRYSLPGGRIAVSIAPHGSSFLECKVSDSGVGIPADEQRLVFQKFFRASSGKARHADGSGLGLYIARSFITALGGDMGFKSRNHSGTTFWFRLPVYS